MEVGMTPSAEVGDINQETDPHTIAAGPIQKSSSRKPAVAGHHQHQSPKEEASQGKLIMECRNLVF